MSVYFGNSLSDFENAIERVNRSELEQNLKNFLIRIIHDDPRHVQLKNKERMLRRQIVEAQRELERIQ